MIGNFVGPDQQVLLAEQQLQLGFVQRAVAAVRGFLREVGLPFDRWS